MSDRIIPIFLGEVLGGKIVLENDVSRRRYRERLSKLEGSKVQLSISKRRQRRSLKQNSYYWGAIIPLIADQVGMLDEEVHDALRWKFLRIHGNKIDSVRSTSELSKGEFVEYLLDIEIWARDFLGITEWPDPERYEEDNILL